MGGENKMKIGAGGWFAAATERQHSERTGKGRRGARGLTGKRLSAALAAIAITATALRVMPVAASELHSQRLVQISGAKRTASIVVTVGKTEDVRIDAGPVTDLTVGDPEIADVTPLTDYTLSILGRKIGTTRITMYAEGKRQIGILDVEVSYDVSSLAREIAVGAGPGIKVSSVNGRIMLSGTTRDAVTLDKAVVMARQFAPDIINNVQVAQPQQVMLEVRFVEASRSAERDLGIKWDVAAKNFSAALGTAGLISGNAPFGVMVARILGNGVTADAMIKALENRGLVRTLAEPNLVALSGDTASFLAGGEYPIPVAASSNAGIPTITVSYKPYGVGLAFTPTVLKDGLINIVIKPDVSQLDPSNSVPVGNGISVPALTVRRASTTVELRDGQSFMIGGLLQTVSKANLEQFPWLADVPVLGALFRSASYQKEETDLAIIVTPRIVRPGRPGDVIQTPLDNTLPANDADLFLMGKTEISKPALRAALGADRPFTGHMLDLPKGAVNVVYVRN
jgi:pilus assembly protein CpaC